MSRKRRHSRGGRFLFCLGLVALFLLANNQIFRVREIVVNGVDDMTRSYIITLSGIREGDSLFDLNERNVQTALSADPYLAFEGMEIQYPDTVILRVRQRNAAAAIAVGGVYVLIDETGQSLEHTTRLPEGMPFVTGVTIDHSTVGTKLLSRPSDQIGTLLAIISALKDQNALSLVAKIDVSDRNNLYLVTQGDVKAILGDNRLLPDKIAWLRASLEEMTRMGYTGGQLDLSSGKNAVFMPGDQ